MKPKPISVPIIYGFEVAESQDALARNIGGPSRSPVDFMFAVKASRTDTIGIRVSHAAVELLLPKGRFTANSYHSGASEVEVAGEVCQEEVNGPKLGRTTSPDIIVMLDRLRRKL
jgi:hypothetical protein